MLKQLQELVAKSNDDLPEYMLDKANIAYEEVSEFTWRDDGKYSYGDYCIKVGEEYFSFNVSRIGSYFTAYYWDIQDVTQYTPDTRYHVGYTFPSKEVAQEFISWMCNSGEQSMWEAGDLELNRETVYDYKEGSMEIKGKFEEY